MWLIISTHAPMFIQRKNQAQIIFPENFQPQSFANLSEGRGVYPRNKEKYQLVWIDERYGRLIVAGL